MSFLISLSFVASTVIAFVAVIDRLVEESWWWEPHRRQRRWRAREVARRGAVYELDGMDEFSAKWKAEAELKNELNAVDRLLQ